MTNASDDDYWALLPESLGSSGRQFSRAEVSRGSPNDQERSGDKSGKLWFYQWKSSLFWGVPRQRFPRGTDRGSSLASTGPGGSRSAVPPAGSAANAQEAAGGDFLSFSIFDFLDFLGRLQPLITTPEDPQILVPFLGRLSTPHNNP